MLTKAQIKRIQTAGSKNVGRDIEISKIQIRKVVKRGGNLFTSIRGLGSRLLPYATTAASKILPGLATGALSSLGNFGMDKILGQGYRSGGFLIPQDKINRLIKHKNLLTKKKRTNFGPFSIWWAIGNSTNEESRRRLSRDTACIDWYSSGFASFNWKRTAKQDTYEIETENAASHPQTNTR